MDMDKDHIAGFTKTNRMVDKNFRWRSGEMTRIEAFSDAVFAFAITLLVVALEVPHTFEELANAMKGFVAFAICFSMLAMVWHAHVKFFRRYGLQTLQASALNCTLLFVVLFYVYPLKFLFTFLVGVFSRGALLPHGPGQSAPMIGDPHSITLLMEIYGLGFAAVFLILFFLYRHAYRLREALELNEMELHLTRYEMMNQFAMMCFGLASAVLAAMLPPNRAGIAGMLYGLIGVYHFVAGWIMGARGEKILARMQSVGGPPASVSAAASGSAPSAQKP
ncbi:MAG TPA: TMEM175 family protein [Terriglobales bacterium]|nr:TMEM175 family protein [Terriglobales bacterium]